MIRINIWLLTLLVFLFAVTPSFAFYEYVDEHGVTRYTDDINEVPEDQRYGKQEYQEPEGPSNETAEPEDQKATETQAPGTKGNDMNYDATMKELKEKEQALTKEREAIEKEDTALLKEKMKLKPDDNMEEYNEKVAKLKEKTRALEEKREEFNRKIDALNEEIASYNEKVASKLESQLQEYETIKSKSDKNSDK